MIDAADVPASLELLARASVCTIGPIRDSGLRLLGCALVVVEEAGGVRVGYLRAG